MVDLTRFAESYAPWGLALLVVWAGYGMLRLLNEARARRRRDAFIEGAGGEPVSLHPVIDPARCVGCSACTNACPEGRIIAMIGGKAQLIDPISCIGHGACKTACPVAAIDLVFGSARRGVDIPVISPTFESSVPGVFIAGELGGMGLIANAIEQGRQAIDSIARLDGLKWADRYDVVIIGAGPAGIAASLAAKEKGLSALTLEQDCLGGTVARYPRGKIAMTRPARLPLYGRVKFRRVRKDRLLALWDDIVRKTGIVIHDRVRVERIITARDGFEVASSKAELFEQSDVLSLHLRLGDETRGVVTLDDLSRMKSTALLVNTSRAELIEPEALISALNRGRPGLAAVDVFESEPILQGHALLRLENCICTPHIGYVEQDSYEMYFSAAFDNVINFIKGTPTNIVNPGALQVRR